MVDVVEQMETHRSVLTGHCYRMLGSVVDAEDAVQETMIRAWRGYESFDGRASLRTWLYRIATNVCLDQLAERSARRAYPVEEAPPGSVNDDLVKKPRTHWLEPIPDVQALPSASNPAEVAALKQTIRLAFVAALQHLPPKQRAVLLLVEVLGWSAAEVAGALDLSVPAVNSALQRARATLAARDTTAPSELTAEQRRLLQNYVDAFHQYDVDRLTALLHHDAKFSMPPFTLWLEGPDAVRGWLNGRGSVCRGSRLMAVEACGSPAFAHYHPTPEGIYRPWAIIVLDVRDDRIASWTSFLDTEILFPRFHLPAELP